MPPKGGKAKAQSAAQAASKKKSSAVEIAHHTEQQIRQALSVRRSCTCLHLSAGAALLAVVPRTQAG
jgi:hypothetical protein